MLGKGKRFFSDGTQPSGLALASTNAVSSGVLISTYTPAGPLRTGSVDEAITGRWVPRKNPKNAIELRSKFFHCFIFAGNFISLSTVQAISTAIERPKMR